MATAQNTAQDSAIAQDGQRPAWPTARRAFVATRLGLMHVRAEAPEDPLLLSRPPLVCLHPPPGSSLDVAGIQRLFSGTRRVLCPDLPGFGASDRPPAPPALADYAGALADALAAMLPGPFDLFASDLSTPVAVALALAEPARVRRLVLARLPLFSKRDRPGLVAGASQPRPILADGEFVGALWRRMLAGRRPGESDGALLDRFADQVRSGPDAVWLARAALAAPLDDSLARLVQPVLVLVLPGMLTRETRAATRRIARCTIEDRDEPDTLAMPSALFAGSVTRYLDAPDEEMPDGKRRR